MQKRMRRKINTRDRKKSVEAASVIQRASLKVDWSLGAASCNPMRSEMAERTIIVKLREASWLKMVVRVFLMA
jgi:hypothetical protein